MINIFQYTYLLCLFSNTNRCYLSALAGVKEVQKENVMTQMNYCLWSLPSCAKKKYHSVEMSLFKGAVIYWQYKHDYVLAHCCAKQTDTLGRRKKVWSRYYKKLQRTLVVYKKKKLGLLKSQILGMALLSHLFPLLFRDRFEKRNLDRKLGLFP